MDFELALAYETDWTWINWLWVGILAVASATWVFAARPALGWASEFDVGYSRGAELRKGALLLGWLLVTLTAGITILSWPGAVMRHIPEPAYVLLTVAVGIIAAIALALLGHVERRSCLVRHRAGRHTRYRIPARRYRRLAEPRRRINPDLSLSARRRCRARPRPDRRMVPIYRSMTPPRTAPRPSPNGELPGRFRRVRAAVRTVGMRLAW